MTSLSGLFLRRIISSSAHNFPKISRSHTVWNAFNSQFRIIGCSHNFTNSYNTSAKLLIEEKTSGILTKISALHAKRPARKKIAGTQDEEQTGFLSVVAYSTAEEYDLEGLNASLFKQGLYQPTSMPEDMHDVLHIAATHQVGKEPREIYFFREGSVVFWNISESEQKSLLSSIKKFATNLYTDSLVENEFESLEYTYTDNKTRLINGRILLNSEGSTDLEKYTFSNGMALSVKLALWEASLDRYVDGMEWVTESMKKGEVLKMTRKEVFKKTGELFALRHLINLSSDLLDTPDFYWDRANLEPLYQKTCNHLNISKRTRVMNEKLNYCCMLMELLSSHLNDQHHTRLEWMIIALIAVEVGFEFYHIISA
ncbi:Required for meiotic nuclear division protein 1 [Nymphon striatum]|nr:Required for meiotic nuclear division protein 1 [Nymphon striatum]